MKKEEKMTRSRDRDSPLQFNSEETEAEQVFEKKLDRLEGKANRAEQKFQKTKQRLPQKRVLKSEWVTDESKGKIKRRFYFDMEAETPEVGVTNKAKLKAHQLSRKMSQSIHQKVSEHEDENVGVEASHKSTKFVEHSSQKLKQHKRLQENQAFQRFQKSEAKLTKANVNYMYERMKSEQPSTNLLNKLFQKRKIKKQYAHAKKVAGTAKTTTTNVKRIKGGIEKAGAIAKEVFAKRKIVAIVGVVILLFVFVSTILSMCSAIMTQTGTMVVASTWLSDDSDINQAELYYTKLEAELQKKINNIEHEHGGYDEYNYNIGAIEHDPVQLISYLSAKFEEFHYPDVQAEIDKLFQAQYQLELKEETITRTVTKEIKVGESLGKVVTSAYCSCVICTGQWTGGPTASGVMPRAKHTIAVDAKNPVVPIGTKIIMNGIEYTVEDTGNFARYGVAFDIYFDTHEEAIQWGHKTVDAYLANGNKNTVTVTTTETIKQLNSTLKQTSMTDYIQANLTDDQLALYEAYMESRGNRQNFGSPFNFDWYPNITSYPGYRTDPFSGEIKLHKGLDIGMAAGTPTQAIHDGIVTTAGFSSGGYGNYVIVEDKEKGYKSLYAHFEKLNVNQGQTVKVGDVVGFVGTTGASTGNHLHLEFYYEEEWMDAYFYASNVGESKSNIGTGTTNGAMSTADYNRLITYAEQYLGFPYVFGGSTPETSFDCSGFISWVYTNSGVNNLPRTTAQGIYDQTTKISREEARAGDLIFFTETYPAGRPVTHIGIYVGNGKMLHCGDPIQYSSIDTPYWQKHFYGFGRLKN
ncbi:peptidoglycan DD-metalloendopeptidase family protein [Listeria weihenstephanensis]|uniref:Peptidoglycan DD-metalloendopeptidase family protein n=1 Tax=Listeria weihenstephanensis TaxID=1006155 RepID=A0A841ZCB0_9LIST|nr:NlpC/P60 family protein [Listeria weihenstephanensis]MBC1502127.1 peptidoglycan DD-metalloendopeptidase family protein [Listeria weihenstephanensis]